MQYSIVNYSEIDKSLFRLEAEFYNSNSLLNAYCFSGEEIIDFVQYGTSKELNEEKRGFPTLRLNEFDSFFIKSPQKYCNEIDNEAFESLALKKGDVLICRTNGNPKLVGKAAIVPEDSNYAFASYLFRIRPKEEKLLPTTLVTYLNSLVGRSEIEKHLMVSNQANFSPVKFREILIPQFGEEIQSSIDKSIWESFRKHSESKQIYAQAQTLLLSELGLTNWQPKHRLTFVKNYSDTEHAERIDADYFQPKYEEIVEAVKNYSGGWDTLGNLCGIKRGSLIKDSFYDQKEGNPYIRGADFSGGWLSDDKLIFISPKFKPTGETRVYENDIVFSLIGSVGETALVTSEFTGAYISNNTGKIECESPIFSVVLQTLLASVIGKLYFEKYKTQTAQPKISDKDLHNFVIPVLSEEKQIQIQQKVVESFNLRKQSKHLLECAKRAVEIAIEQDEQTAIDWLENE